MQIAKIIGLPHLLYTGSNGHKTFGITVENLFPEKGYASKWDINDNTLIEAQKTEVMGKLV